MTRLRSLGACFAAALALFVGVTTSPTGAAYIAQVTNGTDNARSTPYWTCFEAEAQHYLTQLSSTVLPAPELIAEFNVNPNADGGYTKNYGSRDWNDSLHNDFTWWPDPPNYPTVAQTSQPCRRDPAPYQTSSLIQFHAVSGAQMFSEYPLIPQYDVGPVYTAVVWFKTASPGYIMGQCDAGSSTSAFSHALYVDSAGHLRLGDNKPSNGTRTSLDSGKVVTDNMWHFAAMQSTGSAIRLYVDGQAPVELAWVAENTGGPTKRWRWGSSNITAMQGWFTGLTQLQFVGYLAASATYQNKVLTKADIDNIYYAGKP